MQNLKTKDKKNYKVQSVALNSKDEWVYLCIDENYKPVEIKMNQVLEVGK
jgi:hypothetical protein